MKRRPNLINITLKLSGINLEIKAPKPRIDPILRSTWWRMLSRCYNPKDPAYPDYGGRDIRVCDRWRKGNPAGGARNYEGLLNFISDMGPKPSPKHSIDRYPDNDAIYEPSNCRWATAKEQNANKRPPKKRSPKKDKINAHFARVSRMLEKEKQPRASWHRPHRIRISG